MTQIKPEIRSSVDRLNKYPPGTRGYVLVGDRWKSWWIPGVIMGRTALGRRVAAESTYFFVEHDEQFKLKPTWGGERRNPNRMSKIW